MMMSDLGPNNNINEDKTIAIPITTQEIADYQSYVRQTGFFEDLKDEPDLYEDYRE